jgi:hypothetical protein
MTVYAWPGFPVSQFSMSIAPNVRTFTGPYTPTVQVLDLLGERWQITMTLAPTVNDELTGAALEAFFDRLKAQSNAFTLWHLKRPTLLGDARPGSVGALAHHGRRVGDMAHHRRRDGDLAGRRADRGDRHRPALADGGAPDAARAHCGRWLSPGAMVGNSCASWRMRRLMEAVA